MVLIRSYIRTYNISLTLPVNFYVESFADPIVNFELTTATYPEIYQPLVLQCTATIVRSITSTVDIIWTTNNTQVRRVNNVTASSNINSSSIYNNSFIIPSLNLSDIGSVYKCEVLINSILPTTARENYSIPIPGIFLYNTQLYINDKIVNTIMYTCKVVVLCRYGTAQFKLYTLVWVHTCMYTFYVSL